MTKEQMAAVTFWGVLLVAVVALVFGQRAMARKKRARLENRTNLGEREFYELFYAGSGIPAEIVCALILEVSNATGIPPGKLRPTDRFASELSPPKGWEFDDCIAHIHWNVASLVRKLRKTGLEIPEPKITTVDDYIRWMATARRLLNDAK